MSVGMPPMVPLPGNSNLLIRIVPISHQYHLKLRTFVELYRQDEGGTALVGEKEVGSLPELLRATEDLLRLELKRNHPARSVVRAFITNYLSKHLFPEAQDEISADIMEAATEPILEDVRGIGPKVVAELRKKGITDIQQLSRTPEEVLREEVKYLGKKRAKKLKNEVNQQLRSQINGTSD